MICRLLLVVFIAVAAPRARAQELSASSDGTAYFDQKTKERVLTVNARITDGTTLITADEIHYNDTTHTITAMGHAVFTREEIRLLADTFTYQRETKAFTAERVRFGINPYYVEAARASGSFAEITLEQATVTYGEPGPWQPTFRAAQVIYAPGQRLRTEKAQAGIGHTQPLPFSRYQQDLKEPFVSFASLTGGYRSSLGAFAEASLHVPIAARVRLGGDVGYYTARGIMVGPSGSYGNRDSDLRGYFRSGYINDHGDKKSDLLGRPVPEDRAYFEWQHEQNFSDRLKLTGQLNWWKDSEILRDFRPRDFFPVQTPDTFAEAAYAGDNYFVSAFARFKPNSFSRVQERLPEFRFDLLPLAVGNGFVERFIASAASLRDDADPYSVAVPNRVLAGPGNPSAVSGFTAFSFPQPRWDVRRLDAYYALERPFAPREWLAVTPVIGARTTYYSTTRRGSYTVNPSVPVAITPAIIDAGAYTRVLGEVGVDAALRSSATWDYKNTRWKIDGLRHLLTPRVSYRYIPSAGKGRDRIPMIDRRTFATYLQPLGLGDQRNIDDLSATNTLRLGFDNTLQTRDPEYGSRDLLTLNVANDFRFQRGPGERDVSEIHTELGLAPTSWLAADVYGSFAPQSFSLREFNSGVTVHDGDVWSLRFGNNFLRHQIQDYQLGGRVRLNETYEGLVRLHYDARTRRLNEQAYGLAQNLGNTWLVSYIVSLYSGPRRESHFGLNIQIEARGF